MRLWMIRSLRAWRELEETGHLRTDRRYLTDAGERGRIWSETRRRKCSEREVAPDLSKLHISWAYRWIMREMDQRLGMRPAPESVPIWGWYQRAGRGRTAPDLRGEDRAVQMVLMELEVPDGQVLLSDFNLWDQSAWRDSYLPLSRSDERRMDRQIALHPSDWWKHVGEEIEISWQRIFDLHGPRTYNKLRPRRVADRNIQGSFWELSRAQVVGVRFFGKKR